MQANIRPTAIAAADDIIPGIPLLFCFSIDSSLVASHDSKMGRYPSIFLPHFLCGMLGYVVVLHV